MAMDDVHRIVLSVCFMSVFISFLSSILCDVFCLLLLLFSSYFFFFIIIGMMVFGPFEDHRCVIGMHSESKYRTSFSLFRCTQTHTHKVRLCFGRFFASFCPFFILLLLCFRFLFFSTFVSFSFNRVLGAFFVRVFCSESSFAMFQFNIFRKPFFFALLLRLFCLVLRSAQPTKRKTTKIVYFHVRS